MMKHAQYVAAIEYDPESDTFYGRTVNVEPGGFDFWGSSVEELHREFAASAQVFEEVAAEHGAAFTVRPIRATAASAAARKLGQAKSSAKTAAARANGAKGGRPRKSPVKHAAG
jgi:predicted HicB family RNase H-like nuclease